MSYVRFGKTARSWLNDNTRWKGATAHNLKMLREAKVVRSEMRDLLVVCYLLIREYKIDAVQSMFSSAQKQTDLLYAVIADLRKYKLDDEWYPIIKRDLELVSRRCVWVREILKENIRLTNLQPFFEANGFEDLFGLRQGEQELTEKACAELKERIAVWNEKHKDKVSAYEEQIKDEVERIEARRAKIKADERKERDERRERKKQINAEFKEMRENAKKHRKEVRRENRIYEYWCK